MTKAPGASFNGLSYTQQMCVCVFSEVICVSVRSCCPGKERISTLTKQICSHSWIQNRIKPQTPAPPQKNSPSPFLQRSVTGEKKKEVAPVSQHVGFWGSLAKHMRENSWWHIRVQSLSKACRKILSFRMKPHSAFIHGLQWRGYLIMHAVILNYLMSLNLISAASDSSNQWHWIVQFHSAYKHTRGRAVEHRGSILLG